MHARAFLLALLAIFTLGAFGGYLCGWTTRLSEQEAADRQAAQVRAELATVTQAQRDLEALANAAVWTCAGIDGAAGPWTVTPLSGGWYEARLMMRADP